MAAVTAAEISDPSPDVNKPIEHAIHTVKAAFLRALQEGAAAGLTGRRAQTLVFDLWNSKVTPAAVAADVATLPDTVRAIVTPTGQRFVARDGKRYEGSGGDWAPRGLR
ncbi:MAG: hypothetical protein J3K34DRAFT_471995 [Monoraphidium minutum]|nr:MAG: hypothetical protein J3K34DRAFT_471995 [Monoraphidium minutum]